MFVFVACTNTRERETSLFLYVSQLVEYQNIHTYNMPKDKYFVSAMNDTHGEFQVCFKNDRTVGSYGVWVGDNPFNFVVPVTLCQIILASLISRALFYLFRPLQTPKFICCVLVSFTPLIKVLWCLHKNIQIF